MHVDMVENLTQKFYLPHTISKMVHEILIIKLNKISIPYGYYIAI